MYIILVLIFVGLVYFFIYPNVKIGEECSMGDKKVKVVYSQGGENCSDCGEGEMYDENNNLIGQYSGFGGGFLPVAYSEKARDFNFREQPKNCEKSLIFLFH